MAASGDTRVVELVERIKIRVKVMFEEEHKGFED